MGGRWTVTRCRPWDFGIWTVMPTDARLEASQWASYGGDQLKRESNWPKFTTRLAPHPLTFLRPQLQAGSPLALELSVSE